MSVVTDTIGGVVRYGKHKIPRFIYHMTNKSNYESMVKDGMIQATGSDFIGKGVFATELTNFFKRWRKDKSWGSSSLQQELIQHVSKGEDDIVILRIPTAKLNHRFLKIRSQNMLFRWAYNDKYSKTIDEMYDQLYSLGLFEVKRKRKERRMIFDFLSKIENEDSARHVVLGVPAKEAKRYTQRKEAIEYVYRDSIPMEDVEKIGEVNVADLRRTAEYDPLRPMRSIFSALLEGTPEQ